MIRLIKGLLAGLLLYCLAQTARGDRLEAIWIGPNGNGGEGNWNAPANWNLGVVPNNGADGNGDGLPDIFEVRIDKLPAAISLVHSDAPPVEIAELVLDEGDALEVLARDGFLIRDPDSVADVLNNGVIRVGSANALEQRLSFAGEALHLSGNGILDLGMVPGRRGILAAIEGGRFFNGSNHTLQTSGMLHSGRVLGNATHLTSSNVALTNEGTILARDRSFLAIQLNQETHYNDGTIRATSNADLSISAIGGRLWNRGIITADDEGEVSFGGQYFFNDENAEVRASGGTVRFSPPTGSGIVSNAGLIEAVQGGAIVIEGKNPLNQPGGVIRASSGGVIALRNGTFTWDGSYRILDEQSVLSISRAAFDTQGNVLTAEPGILELHNAHVIGGQLTNGTGQLRIDSALLEDIAVRGTVSRGNISPEIRLGLIGTINVFSDLTVLDNARITLDRADAVIRGDGLSKFQAVSVDAGSFTLEIASGHWAEFGALSIDGGELRNNGVIDCSTNFTVSRGTLSGNGAVVTREIRIDDVISPGNGIGVLSLVGDVSFRYYSTDLPGTYVAELGPSDSDMLVITGDLRMTTALDSLMLSGGQVGRSYTIARYTGEREGIFDNVTPGYNVIYDDLAKQIRVEVIPEPASVALAAFALVIGSLAGLRLRCRWLNGQQ